MKGRRFQPGSRSVRMGCCAILAAAVIGCGLPARAQVSPTTGCEVPPGRFLPVLVSVGHGYGTARAEGKTVQAAGAGKVALWGVQQADIVYESLLYRDEQKNAASTRLTLLFSDALLRGEKVRCGPVRSLRDASASLREEWQGALAFGSTMGGGDLGDAVERLKADSAAAFAQAKDAPRMAFAPSAPLLSVPSTSSMMSSIVRWSSASKPMSASAMSSFTCATASSVPLPR